MKKAIEEEKRKRTTPALHCFSLSLSCSFLLEKRKDQSYYTLATIFINYYYYHHYCYNYFFFFYLLYYIFLLLFIMPPHLLSFFVYSHTSTNSPSSKQRRTYPKPIDTKLQVRRTYNQYLINAFLSCSRSSNLLWHRLQRARPHHHAMTSTST